MHREGGPKMRKQRSCKVNQRSQGSWSLGKCVCLKEGLVDKAKRHTLLSNQRNPGIILVVGGLSPLQSLCFNEGAKESCFIKVALCNREFAFLLH